MSGDVVGSLLHPGCAVFQMASLNSEELQNALESIQRLAQHGFEPATLLEQLTGAPLAMKAASPYGTVIVARRIAGFGSGEQDICLEFKKSCQHCCVLGLSIMSSL